MTYYLNIYGAPLGHLVWIIFTSSQAVTTRYRIVSRTLPLTDTLHVWNSYCFIFSRLNSLFLSYKIESIFFFILAFIPRKWDQPIVFCLFTPSLSLTMSSSSTPQVLISSPIFPYSRLLWPTLFLDFRLLLFQPHLYYFSSQHVQTISVCSLSFSRLCPLFL